MADLQYGGLDEFRWELGFFRFFDFFAAFISALGHSCLLFCVVGYDYALGAQDCPLSLATQRQCLRDIFQQRID